MVVGESKIDCYVWLDCKLRGKIICRICKLLYRALVAKRKFVSWNEVFPQKWDTLLPSKYRFIKKREKITSLERECNVSSSSLIASYIIISDFPLDIKYYEVFFSETGHSQLFRNEKQFPRKRILRVFIEGGHACVVTTRRTGKIMQWFPKKLTSLKKKKIEELIIKEIFHRFEEICPDRQVSHQNKWPTDKTKIYSLREQHAASRPY